MIRIEIDGEETLVEAGTTVLEAARSLGREIPTLCFDDRQDAFGACRVCLVGIEGAPGPNGVLHDAGPRRHEGRHTRPGVAARRNRRRRAGAVRAPAAAGRAHRAGADQPHARRRHAALARRAARREARREPPYLAFHHELCISCGRCVRACDEVQGTFALTATGRGFGANVAAGLDEGFRESACVSCGACADTCPTDAITEPSLLQLADPDLVR